ncbi:MAG: TolC family protein, partial [Cyclobacteriaceae bacterium]|nr:TolC family protein [Cyclobacteriaceae bacterium]
RPGVEFPELLGDYMLGAFADWEVDIWKKLRNSKKSQYFRYLSSIEGRNFMVTNLIAEIANTYYELLALDNELEIAKQNIEIQNNAYNIVKVQKQTARVTELAVRRFEAQVLDTRALQYKIQQEIIETENRLNFLLGRFPRPIPRDPLIFSGLSPDTVLAGVPAQLLQNRPDIRQAEMELEAAKLNVKAARAQFYPSLGITGGLGYQAYNPRFLISTPESILLGLAGEATMPLINRRAILATYKNAGATQMQAVINYEQVLLNAYIEVANQIANIDNLQESYKLKEQQVEALNASVNISNSLFMSARADYMEVLLTQQEALESRFELVETKMLQLHAWINVYRALGGGWN